MTSARTEPRGATSSDRRRSERQPGEARQVVLVTPNGPITGLLTDISNTGALVAADGHDLAGAHVALCIPGKRVWVRKGVVVWYSLLRGVSIEFDGEEEDARLPHHLGQAATT